MIGLTLACRSPSSDPSARRAPSAAPSSGVAQGSTAPSSTSSAVVSSSASAPTKCADSDPLDWKPWTDKKGRCDFRTRETTAKAMTAARWEPCPVSHGLGSRCRKLVVDPGTRLWDVGPGGPRPVGADPGEGFAMSITRECDGERYHEVVASEGRVLAALRALATGPGCRLTVTGLADDRWAGRIDYPSAPSDQAPDEASPGIEVAVIGALFGKSPEIMDTFASSKDFIDVKTSRTMWATSSQPGAVFAASWGKARGSLDGKGGILATLSGGALFWARGRELMVSSNAVDAVSLAPVGGSIVDIANDGHDLAWVVDVAPADRRLFASPTTTDKAALSAREVGTVAGRMVLLGCGRALFDDRKGLTLVRLDDGKATTLPQPRCDGATGSGCWDAPIALTCDELVIGFGRNDHYGKGTGDHLTVVRLDLGSLGAASPAPSPSAAPSSAPGR